jgi:DNA-binding Lrp family transcriptional regulator
MKQEKLVKLLFELIKNSRRSDRELAKSLDISQPTITRLRRVLEKEAIQQYTVIPDLAFLGFELVALTFASSKKLVHPLWDKGKEWAQKQPNVMYVSTGQGMDVDAVMVSVHKDYADFVRFYQAFRRDWSEQLQDFRIFLISVKGSVIMKKFSFNCLVDAYNETET